MSDRNNLRGVDVVVAFDVVEVDRLRDSRMVVDPLGMGLQSGVQKRRRSASVIWSPSR